MNSSPPQPSNRDGDVSIRCRHETDQDASVATGSGRSNPDRLMSVKDCAAMLRCHPATIWRMVKSDQFPKPLRLGHLTRWSELEVQHFLTQTRVSQA